MAGSALNRSKNASATAVWTDVERIFGGKWSNQLWGGSDTDRSDVAHTREHAYIGQDMAFEGKIV